MKEELGIGTRIGEKLAESIYEYATGSISYSYRRASIGFSLAALLAG